MKTILFGGRISYLKGATHIVRALKLVVDRVPDARLMVMGESVGKSCEDMLKEARKLGIEKRIIFTGWITGEELKNAFYLADIVVNPSLYPVPFPMVNLEAMACKKPVVATCFGGSPEAVQDGISGYIVNPYNVKAMADKIVYLLQNPGIARKMGLAGYQRVKESFSLEKQAQETLSWYKYFLQNPRRVGLWTKAAGFFIEPPLKIFNTILYSIVQN